MANPVRRPPGRADAWRPMLAGGAAIGVVALAAVPFLTARTDSGSDAGPGPRPAEIAGGEAIADPSGGVVAPVAEIPAVEAPAPLAPTEENPPSEIPARPSSAPVQPAFQGTGPGGKSGTLVNPAVRRSLAAKPFPAAPTQAKGAIGPQFIVGLKDDPRAATLLKLWNSDPEGARHLYSVWAAGQRGAFDGLVLVGANPWSQELVLEIDPTTSLGVSEAMRRLRDSPAVKYAERNTIGKTQDGE